MLSNCELIDYIDDLKVEIHRLEELNQTLSIEMVMWQDKYYDLCDRIEYERMINAEE